MASSPLLSSRLSLLPSSFALLSAPAPVRAFAPSSPSSSDSFSAAGAVLSSGNSAAACSRSSSRTAGRGLGESARHRYTSNFNGASVPLSRLSPTRKTRRRASPIGNPGVISSPRSALVQKVTANELDSILSAERTSPMIIDFYATWCGPCVVLAQELELLAEEYGDDVRFLKVDTDEEHELASQMEIRGLPTMVFVSKDVDKLAIRTEGLLPTNAIRDIIEKEILV